MKVSSKALWVALATLAGLATVSSARAESVYETTDSSNATLKVFRTTDPEQADLRVFVTTDPKQATCKVFRSQDPSAQTRVFYAASRAAADVSVYQTTSASSADERIYYTDDPQAASKRSCIRHHRDRASSSAAAEDMNQFNGAVATLYSPGQQNMGEEADFRGVDVFRTGILNIPPASNFEGGDGQQATI